MALAKPANFISWTNGDAAKQVEPSAAKKLLGWVALERPPFEYMNHLFFRLDEWQQYFESITDENSGFTQFDVTIGAAPSNTHASLNAAVADGALGANVNVLITEAIALTVTQNLTKAGWRIFFKPLATLSDAGAGTGLNIDADGIQIIRGRHTGFTTAIIVAATRKNVRIEGNNFSGNTTEITDGGDNTLMSGNLVEV